MKTIKGLSFGFSAVNAGQRNVSVEPQLIATSTEGNFRITGPVSRILGIASGENVMFINNVDNIDTAIAQRADVVVAFCEENKLDITSPEAAIALHKEFDMWAIAKGIQDFDAKGNAKMITERLSKNDKLRYVAANFDEMLEAAMAEADDQVKDALSRDGITKEEQMDILSAFVTPNEVIKFKGAKTANPANMTGVGNNLNFTDSNVWKQLKVDMGDDATKLNRVYNLDVDNIQDITINNGYEDVTVKALVLTDYVDQEPVRISKKDNADAEEAND